MQKNGTFSTCFLTSRKMISYVIFFHFFEVFTQAQ